MRTCPEPARIATRSRGESGRAMAADREYAVPMAAHAAASTPSTPSRRRSGRGCAPGARVAAQPARGRAPHRRVAKPDLPDRARQGQPEREHAVRARARARADHGRPVRSGGAAATTNRTAARAAAGPRRQRRQPRAHQPRVGCHVGTADPGRATGRGVPPRRLRAGRRVVPRRLPRPPRRKGVRLRAQRPARGADRVRRVRARLGRFHLVRLLVATPAVGDRRRAVTAIWVVVGRQSDRRVEAGASPGGRPR